jgi:hypothetical protein
MVSSHGRVSAGRGAVPPKPVAAPPEAATWLPAASVRLSTCRPLAPSRTTMVCTVSASNSAGFEVSPPDEVNLTVPVPAGSAL